MKSNEVKTNKEKKIMAKNTATEPVTLSNLNTATKPKSNKPKAPKVTKAKAVRVSNGRKEIQAALRSLSKIEKTFTKSRETLSAERAALNGDVGTQMDQVLAQLNTAITVTQSEIELKANALARTFLPK
jgi:hypothetical protein